MRLVVNWPILCRVVHQAGQSGPAGGAMAVYGDRTCLHGQNGSVAPPLGSVNVLRRRVVGRRSRFGDPGVSCDGARGGDAVRQGMGRSGPPYTPAW